MCKIHLLIIKGVKSHFKVCFNLLLIKARLQMLTILLFGVSHVIAQKSLSTLKLNTNEITDFQAFLSKDSIFIYYLEKNLQLQQTGYFYPNGSFEKISFKHIPKAGFCGFETVNGERYHYFFENRKKGEVILKSLYFNGGISNILDEDIVINEKIIGVINDNGLLVIGRDQKKNLLVVYNISKFKTVTKEAYPLSDKYSSLEANDFQLISPTAGWIYETNGKFKIYLKDGKLSLTLDHKGGTDIVLYKNSVDAPKLITIPSPPDSHIKSFLCDSLLFRLTIYKKGLSVFVYKSHNGTVVSRKSLKTDDKKKGQTI